MVSDDESRDVCEACGYNGPRWQFQVHHRDRDRKNNSSGNLVVLCIPCHRQEHGRRVNGGRHVSRSVDWERLDAVVRVRVDAETKDLWVEAAGGSRLLSRWVRERCDAAVSEAGLADGAQGDPATITVVKLSSETEPPVSLTAEVCPAAAMSHKPGSTCRECGTVFPPLVVAAAPVERVFRPDFKVKP